MTPRRHLFGQPIADIARVGQLLPRARASLHLQPAEQTRGDVDVDAVVHLREFA
jgi:hypothetical protein